MRKPGTVRTPWRAGLRGLVVLGAVVGMLAATMLPASAATQPFAASVVGGSVAIGTTGPISIGGNPACSNGTDDEYDAPFVPTKDTLIDFPADPQCATPFDGDEKVAGFQAPTPISVSGTIDDVTGAFTVPVAGLNWQPTTLTVTTPLVAFVANDTDLDSPMTGTVNYGSGQVDITSLDMSFYIQLCIPAFLCTNPPPPHGTGTTWTANCIVDVNPPAVSTTDPAGSAYSYFTGRATVADTDFSIPAPTDNTPPGTVSCPTLAGAFGLPSATNDVALELATNGPLFTNAISIGNSATSIVEPGATGQKGKALIPVTVNPAPAADLVLAANTTDGTAIAPGDYKALVNKAVTIKAGKTQGKVAVTVYGDGIAESDETLNITLTCVSGPCGSYQFVRQGKARVTIEDPTGANTVALGNVEVTEGSATGGKAKASVPVSLQGAVPTGNVTLTYCTTPITATEGVDYLGVSCGTPKTKIVKAGKQSTVINVTVLHDTTSEPDEAMAVWVIGVSGSGYSIGQPFGVVTIKTDE
jgi:hypothetical protein